MTTDAAIIAEAQAAVRDTQLGGVGGYLSQRLNRIYRDYCRRPGVNWPQLRFLNQTLTTVSGTQAYPLPANFSRMCEDYVLYNPMAITGGYQGGWLLPILKTGTPDLDARLAPSMAQVTADPQFAVVASTSAAGATGLQLTFFPPFTNGGYLVAYNYYANPVTLDGSGITFEVQDLAETLVNALTKEACLYKNDMPRAQYYAAAEKVSWMGARSVLYVQ